MNETKMLKPHSQKFHKKHPDAQDFQVAVAEEIVRIPDDHKDRAGDQVV